MKEKEVKSQVTEQLLHLQMLLHRMAFCGYFSGGAIQRNPYRGQGKVLALLKTRPEIKQKELAELLDMSKQSLAELLAKLEKKEYIARGPSPDDKRSITVRLLDKGRKAAEDMDVGGAEAFQVLDCLNGEELAQFSEYLCRVIKGCEAYFPGEGYEERRKKLDRFMASRREGGARRSDGVEDAE